jgi:hypothetical protein
LAGLGGASVVGRLVGASGPNLSRVEGLTAEQLKEAASQPNPDMLPDDVRTSG